MKKLRKVDARGWMGRAVGLKGRVLGGWRGAGPRLPGGAEGRAEGNAEGPREPEGVQ